MTTPDGLELSPAERAAWLRNLIHAAELAAVDLRARDDPTHTTVLIADLDDLCVRLRDELDQVA